MANKSPSAVHEREVKKYLKKGWAAAGFMKFVRSILDPDYVNRTLVPDCWRVHAYRVLPAERDEFEVGHLCFSIQAMEIVHMHPVSKSRIVAYAWLDETICSEVGWRLDLFVRDMALGSTVRVDLNTIYEASWKRLHPSRSGDYDGV